MAVIAASTPPTVVVSQRLLVNGKSKEVFVTFQLGSADPDYESGTVTLYLMHPPVAVALKTSVYLLYQQDLCRLFVEPQQVYLQYSFRYAVESITGSFLQSLLNRPQCCNP